MSYKRHTQIVSLLLSLNALPAQAVLQSRAGGTMIYDTDRDITWLADANYAKTSGYNSTGLLNWASAMAWADNLVFGGLSDWRLPIITDTGTPGGNQGFSGTDFGWNVDTTGSEMAHMYQDELGLKSYYSTSGVIQSDWGIFGNATLNGVDNSSSGQNDIGLVHNLQAAQYWSSTEYATISDAAWNYAMGSGTQGNQLKSVRMYAWAVRPGDVPVPAAFWLLGSGIGLLSFINRRN